MRLYSGMSRNFIEDTVRNQIAGKLEDAFFRHFRFKPSPGEVNSWRNSLRAVAQVFQASDLLDHGVILEYQLPLTSKRLDCLICGRNGENADGAVIVELKQWDKCSPALGERLVTTWVGGAEREVLHPSAQVGQYQLYLEDAHTAFYEGPAPVALSSCAYLHNYFAEPDDTLFLPQFAELTSTYPVFAGDDVEDLSAFLVARLHGGNGADVLERIEQSRYRPSKKLMDHVGNLIKGGDDYILLDEQLVVYETVLAWARKGFHDRRPTVIVVRGGPGTGKSVIAMNLVGDLLLQGYNAQYATGSKAFTETLRRNIGTRGAVQFKYFNSYMDADRNAVDVLVCDEAHRIREFSHDRWTPKAKRSNQPQIQELLNAAKVAVFFIDDKQLVRPTEIGSAHDILDTAEKLGCRIFEHELEAQFRCAGSAGFVNWVNNTLGIERTANVLWDIDAEEFDFRIYPTVEELDLAIRERAAQGHSARLTAGFCWPWSKKPNADGTLVEDVVIGDFRRAWNARPEATRLAKGIPKAPLWANDPGGLEQIGCVYTAQGFEFDYVGVIFGRDLRYDFDSQSWRGYPEDSYDTPVKRAKGGFVDLVKNTYRVLLSRGLKGCYVCFVDKETERFFKSRIDVGTRRSEDQRMLRKVAEPPADYGSTD